MLLALKPNEQTQKSRFTSIQHFINPNSKEKLRKIICSIIEGVQIQINQKKLDDLRKMADYLPILCQIITEYSTRQGSIGQDIKYFIALELKKNYQRLNCEQCWWLMRQIYYTQNDKIVRFIREACLLYKPALNSTNFLYIFLIADMEQTGIIGLVRYLILVGQILVESDHQSTIKQYGQEIVNKIYEMLFWDPSDYLLVSELTYLIMLHERLKYSCCWQNIKDWSLLLQNIINQNKSPLINFLLKYLQRQIDYQRQQLPFAMQNHQIIKSIEKCLQNLRDIEVSLEKKVYFHCLQILKLYCRKNFVDFQSISDKNNRLEFFAEAFKLFENQVEKLQEINGQFHFLQSQEGIQNDSNEKLINFSILSEIIKPISPLDLRELFGNSSTFIMKMISFSLYIPTIVTDQYIQLQQFQLLLDNLYSAVEQQQDTFLFVKEKKHFIWTLLRFIMRFYKHFEKNLILKTCFVVDYLAYRCESVAKETFQILQTLCEEIVGMESIQLLNFLETTLKHVNENQWNQNHASYLHIINLLVNTSPEIILNKLSKNQVVQTSSMQRQIIKMIQISIDMLKQSFNYETMQKLNVLIQYIINQPKSVLFSLIRYDWLKWVSMTNFRYEILSDSFVDIYFCFSQFHQNRQQFLGSLELFKFWEHCETEKVHFFANVYIKYIDSWDSYEPAQREKKLGQFRNNLWDRFRNEPDDQQRYKIAKIFEFNKKYFGSLYAQFQKAIYMSSTSKQSKFKSKQIGFQSNFEFD